MRSFDIRIASLLAVAIALAACQPPRDVRPPYHEPVAATSASQAATPAPHPVSQPGR